MYKHYHNSHCLPLFFTKNLSIRHHDWMVVEVSWECWSMVHFAVARGLRSTRITESPRRNILEINLSLFTGLDFFLPLPVFGTSVHISLTFSSTMLQCLEKRYKLVSKLQNTVVNIRYILLIDGTLMNLHKLSIEATISSSPHHHGLNIDFRRKQCICDNFWCVKCKVLHF